MNRRDSLKALGIGTLSAGTLLAACKPGEKEPLASSGDDRIIPREGKQGFEIARDKALLNDKFFNVHELLTITLLADIIIPKDVRSGSASDAKVSDFIEFIVKDEPEHQLPMRGGLLWLDQQCLKRYQADFKTCNSQQQKEIVREIAYPMKAKPAMRQGVAFFDKMRDLTAIGFFTTKMGIDDLGYKGNAPGKWEGVPMDILKQYGLEDV